MNISTSYAAVQYQLNGAILRSANKQPELALDLILQTTQNLQSPQQTVAQPVAQPTTTGPEQLIDIVV
jgi:hypothetical protein